MCILTPNPVSLILGLQEVSVGSTVALPGLETGPCPAHYRLVAGLLCTRLPVICSLTAECASLAGPGRRVGSNTGVHLLLMQTRIYRVHRVNTK